MNKKRIKKGLAIALSTAMMLGVMPSVGNGLTEVYAADSMAPTADQYIDMSSLSDKATGFSSYNLIGTTNAAKIKFGASGREWLIAGADGANTLALLSATSFGSSEYGPNSIYGNDNNAGETSIVLSKLNGYLSDTAYFSAGEKERMQSTKVKTTGYDGTERTVTGKLYLPDAKNMYSNGANLIYVGTQNNIEITVTNLTSNGGTSNYFWLRSPYDGTDYMVLDAYPQSGVGFDPVGRIYVSVVPAFDLNLSSVLFASAANAATSEGTLTVDEAFTLRYAGTSLGSAAIINPSRTKVAVADAPSGTYLVVQNKDGAWAQSVSGAATVNAGNVTINSSTLTSFTDCKVWLETTDTDRITTATLATQATGYDVDISAGINMTKTSSSGDESQAELTGTMTDVVYTADDGYYFPTDYSVATVNGIRITRDSYSQITVSGTPTASASITLTAAIKKETQAAPIGLNGGVYKIAGTTTDMEYSSTADATSWNSCMEDHTTVAAGKWYVRYKETDTKKAGATMEVTVTESPNPSKLYQVTVNNGSGDGSYFESEQVTITADNHDGYTFANWTSDDYVIFKDSKAYATTFTMPDKPVTITANFSTDNHYLIDKATASTYGDADKNGYATITLEKTSYVYTGSEILPVPVVSFTYTEYDGTGKQTGRPKTKKLVENVDYTMSYTQNLNTGSSTILVSGIGDYKGTMSHDFLITAKTIKNAVIEPIEDVKATGADLKSQMDARIIVKDGVHTVSRNDYDITYLVKKEKQTILQGSLSENTVVTVSVSGKNNYKNAMKKTQTFTILAQTSTAASVADFAIVLKAPVKIFTYSGKVIKPQITVKDAGTNKPIIGKYYKISYENNVNAGTGTITVSGKKNYYGSKSITFTIQPKQISKVKVKALLKIAYRETIEDLELKITDGGRYLKKGEDFTVDFSSSKDLSLGTLNVKKVTLSVNAVDKSNYTGKKEVTCYIIPRSLTNKISTKIDCSDVTYTETVKKDGAKPIPIIHYNGDELVPEKDFTIVKYSNNKRIGTGKIVIQGIGNYKGKRIINFKITK